MELLKINNQNYVKYVENGQMVFKRIIKPITKPLIRIISNHYCYLLESENPSAKKKYYFGYTVDPERRLRQHNAEITGGAKKTKRGRPWKMLFYISGFENNHSALSFEYRVIKTLNKKHIYSVDKALPIIYDILNKQEKLIYTFNWINCQNRYKNTNFLHEIK